MHINIPCIGLPATSVKPQPLTRVQYKACYLLLLCSTVGMACPSKLCHIYSFAVYPMFKVETLWPACTQTPIGMNPLRCPHCLQPFCLLFHCKPGSDPVRKAPRTYMVIGCYQLCNSSFHISMKHLNAARAASFKDTVWQAALPQSTPPLLLMLACCPA